MPATPSPPYPTLLATALGTLAIALAGPPTAQAAPDHALASASYGQAEVWWQRKPGDRARRELVIRAKRRATPRVLPLPAGRRYTTDLALGLDAHGTLAVVVKDPRGLAWTRLSEHTRLRHVPGSTPADSSPSLLRGRIAYLGDALSTVRLGSLTGPRAHTIWTSRESSFIPWDLALGAGNAVVLVTYLEGAEAASYRALLIRAGTAHRQLMPTLRVGHERASDMRIARVSTTGRRFTITQRVDDTTSTQVHALPGGRRISKVAARERVAHLSGPARS